MVQSCFAPGERSHSVRIAVVPSLQLRLPDALHSLGEADIVGLELVQANADDKGGCVETPLEKLACLGIFAVGNVVDDDGLETHVAVDEDGGAQQGIHAGVQRPGSERSNRQGHQAGRKQALEGPVVRAMGRARVGYRGGIVH